MVCTVVADVFLMKFSGDGNVSRNNGVVFSVDPDDSLFGFFTVASAA